MDMSVSLSDELALFVESKVATGRCTSSSEVVHEALRLMKQVERQDAERLRSLRTAGTDGVDSGDTGETDVTALKAEARDRRAAPHA